MTPFGRIVLATAIFALGLVGIGGRADAANRLEGWKRLGEKMVDHRAERDEIIVGADEGAFQRIKLEVKGADVEFINVRVVFGSGQDQDIEIRKKIGAGGETRPIDLDGRNRVIKKVVLVYKTERDERRRGVVVLYGHR